MSDWLELSSENHELNYILSEFKIKQTDHNRRQLANTELTFKLTKGGAHTKKYSKAEFYEYLKAHLTDFES